MGRGHRAVQGESQPRGQVSQAVLLEFGDETSELTRNDRNWDEVSAQGTPCPISSTDDELVAHLREGQHWNERAGFWDSIGHFVSRDGRTSHEDSEDALRFFATLREEGLESLEGEELAVFERGSRCTVLRGVE